MSKQTIYLVLSVVILIVVVAWNKFQSPANKEELKKIINGGAFLVDVRTPGEFSGGSVKGAVNIPLSDVKNQLAKFKNKENIVVFCQSGGRSSQAKRILEKNRITNVYNGGGWSNVHSLLEK